MSSSRSPQLPAAANMSEGGSSSSAASASNLSGVDIHALLDATLPVVKCVLLKCDGTMEEKDVDMTPKKQEVASLLGRPVAFLGQWEQLEIIIVTVRDDTGCSINTHKLPAPFHESAVKGDILLIRTDSEAVPQDITLDEYAVFQKKDPEPWQLKKIEEEDEEEDEDDDDDEEDEDDEDDEDGDEEYEEGEDDEDDEAAAAEFKEFLLSKIVQKFEETNSREPNEEELAALKASLDQKFGGGEEEDGDDEEDAEDGSNVVLDKIVAAFKDAHGRDPTEDEIKDILRRMQAPEEAEEAEDAGESETKDQTEPLSKKQKTA